MGDLPSPFFRHPDCGSSYSRIGIETSVRIWLESSNVFAYSDFVASSQHASQSVHAVAARRRHDRAVVYLRLLLSLATETSRQGHASLELHVVQIRQLDCALSVNHRWRFFYHSS